MGEKWGLICLSPFWTNILPMKTASFSAMGVAPCRVGESVRRMHIMQLLNMPRERVTSLCMMVMEAMRWLLIVLLSCRILLKQMIFRKEPFFHGHDNYDQLVRI